MHAVRNLIGVSVVGIVGIVIVMAIAIGTNVTGWSGKQLPTI